MFCFEVALKICSDDARCMLGFVHFCFVCAQLPHKTLMMSNIGITVHRSCDKK